MQKVKVNLKFFSVLVLSALLSISPYMGGGGNF